MNTLEQVVAVANQAAQHAAAGNTDQAVKALVQAIALARALDQPRLLAALFLRLGNQLQDAGDIQNPLAAYEFGLKALRNDPDLDVSSELGRFIRTGKMMQDPAEWDVPDLYSATVAADLEQAAADNLLAVKLLINAANMYLLQNQPHKAEEHYRNALARGEIDAEHAGHALANIGFILRHAGKLDEADAALQDALAHFEKANLAPESKRRALAFRAGIERDRGDTGAARATYEEALALYTSAADSSGAARVLAGLGHLHLQAGRFAEALPLYDKAIAQADDGDVDTLWTAHLGRARCQHAAQALDAAAASLEKALAYVRQRAYELKTDEGKVSFLGTVTDVFDLLVEVHLDRGAFGDALSAAEESRGRALEELVHAGQGFRARRKPGNEDPPEAFRDSRSRPFEERGGPPIMAQMAIGIESGQPKIQEAPSLELPADFDPGRLFGSRSDEPADSPVQMAMGVPSPQPHSFVEPDPFPAEPVPSMPPLARLVFHLLDDRTAVFAVSASEEGQPVQVACHIHLQGRAALAARVEALREDLAVRGVTRGGGATRVSSGEPQPLSADDFPWPVPLDELKALYLDLVAPVSHLLPADQTPVVIEPHGPLWLLPFAALVDERGLWLADRWPLLYAPSARSLAAIRNAPDYGGPQDLEAMLVAVNQPPELAPRHDVPLPSDALEFAAAEVAEIARLFPADRRRVFGESDPATREVVLAEAQKYGILHFATHGIAFDVDPLDSLVILAGADDGDPVLSARDVMRLDLPADLVALSACQTALGKVTGDGMIGLARAFQAAGARSVLVSLWSVSDDATRVLMKAFYEGYVEFDDKALALQNAMRTVRQADPDFIHPFYWAAFVVVGAEA